MIEVKNISFKYAGQKDLVFDDFSLELKQDNIYGLLGKNGTCAPRRALSDSMASRPSFASLKRFRRFSSCLRSSTCPLCRSSSM